MAAICTKRVSGQFLLVRGGWVEQYSNSDIFRDLDVVAISVTTCSRNKLDYENQVSLTRL